ncbi:MAG TPA: peptidoglycan-associated lipoprotein Pal [Nevskiaceae bacterium]|nr:peptidoglycan-associated lipoprotein Pal [Nevskiaceae bacterium]
MLKQVLITGVVATVLAVSGCAGKGKKGAAGADAGSGFATSGTGDDSIATGRVIGGSGSDDTSGLDLSQRTVYFAYDSAEISVETRSIVERFGRFLVANPTKRVRLEGHADERGTREYNVGLGENRANAVREVLLGMGVSASQISVVSYGEERPAVPGSDEAAYAKNRRVEIVQL